MGLIKKRRVLVIVNEDDVPVDPTMKKRVKFKGKRRQWRDILFGLFIIFMICAFGFFASILLWEMIKS